MADRDIPEEVVETVNRVAAAVENEWAGRANRDAYVGQAIREAAYRAVRDILAGRTVVDLPEPDGRTYDGSVRWDASARRIIAKVDKQGRPFVRVDDKIWLDGEAESVGLALVAAAREARRLAAGSRVGDQTRG